MRIAQLRAFGCAYGNVPTAGTLSGADVLDGGGGWPSGLLDVDQLEAALDELADRRLGVRVDLLVDLTDEAAARSFSASAAAFEPVGPVSTR